MDKSELIVAAMIASVASLVSVGLYVELFDVNRGKLKESARRTMANAARVVVDYARRRTALLVTMVVAVAAIALVASHIGELRALVAAILSRGR